jgi:hypothetical protein
MDFGISELSLCGTCHSTSTNNVIDNGACSTIKRQNKAQTRLQIHLSIIIEGGTGQWSGKCLAACKDQESD